MAQILVEFDPTIKQSEIIMPLASPSPDQEKAPDYPDRNMSGEQQISVYGVLSPLIAINNSVINFDDVLEMTLDGTGPVPEVSIIAVDTAHNIENIDNPGTDNELRLQIIPPFDNAYKKINLTFHLSSLKTINGIIHAQGSYRVPTLSSSYFKSFGKISTYELFRTIATETGLGFASNVSDTDDQRFIYCDHKSYKRLLEKQIKMSGGDPVKIYDYWIDFWNNLNLVDVYERFNTIDPEEEMMVWVAAQPRESTAGVDIKPVQIAAVLTNHPGMATTELAIESKNFVVDGTANMWDGTDKVVSIYEMSKNEYLDHMIQNSSVKKDIFTHYQYEGEVYGDVNYMINKMYRESYLQIINNNTIEVVAKKPLLGLMRGKQVRLNWYIAGDQSIYKMKDMEDAGLISQNLVNPNVDVDPQYTAEQQKHINPDVEDHYIIDKQSSGQYLIVGSKIKYTRGEWKNVLVLSRPESPRLISSEE